MPAAPKLIERFVVEATCDELRRRGWDATPVASTASRGVDIVATRGRHVLHVEAKGAGSSQQHTSRYGKAFDSRQVDTCVSKAVLRALDALSGGRLAGVAFPDNAAYRARVDRAANALAMLAVAIFWVAEDGNVRVENAGALVAAEASENR